ncbi:MAG: hypothetical protein B6I20_08145 [Bacteroidetes bacterium 4572_117]|nr:MAG: hypothetical protein B6I20_08145 [Bacteroidetes bacterium 4572_117]
MILSFIDKESKPLADLDIFFEYSDTNDIKTTNTNGVVELTGFEKNLEFACYISKKEKKGFKFQETGELSIIFKRPTVDMTFVVAGKSGEAATNLEVHFKYNDKQIKELTNSTGQIVLKNIPLKTIVKAYQLFKNKEENTEGFICERDKSQYFYVADKLFEKANMNFKLIDKNGVAIKNSDVRFRYEKKEFETVTNNEGRLTIKDVKIGALVECKQLMFGKSLPIHKFKFDKQVDEYIIHGEKQIPFSQEKMNYDSDVSMKIKLVNSKTEPIANAIIKLEYNGTTRNKYTDLNGEIQVDDVQIGNIIKAFADVRGNSTEAEFICDTNNETHQLVLKTDSGKLFLWVIPLIIIAALAFLFIKVDLSSFKMPEKKPEQKIVIKDTVTIANYKISVKDKAKKNAIENVKVELVYADSSQIKFSNKMGEVNFTAIKNKKPLNVTISLLGFYSSTASFTAKTNTTLFITKDDSIDVAQTYLACGELTQSAGFKTTIKTFKMKMEKGRFKLFFNMFNLPDQIDIYNGALHNISKEKLIYSSNKKIKGLKNTHVIFNSPDSLITVQVTGSDNKTSWLYKVFCPRKTTEQN